MDDGVVTIPRRVRGRPSKRPPGYGLLVAPSADEVPIGELWMMKPRRKRAVRKARRYGGLAFAGHLTRFYAGARGEYRVFGRPLYLAYRSNTGPPEEGDTHYAAWWPGLGYTPSDTFADGIWYLSMAKTNGRSAWIDGAPDATTNTKNSATRALCLTRAD